MSQYATKQFIRMATTTYFKQNTQCGKETIYHDGGEVCKFHKRKEREAEKKARKVVKNADMKAREDHLDPLAEIVNRVHLNCWECGCAHGSEEPGCARCDGREGLEESLLRTFGTDSSYPRTSE
jgi:hypothetical protein